MILKNRSCFVKKLNKYLLCFLLATFACLFTACGSEANTKVVLTTGLAADEIFRIENISCYEPEMMVYLTNMQNQYENVYGEKIWETNVGGESLEQNVKDNALAKMAQVKTMNLMAEEMDISLNQEEVKKVENAANIYYSSLNNTEIEAMNIDEKTIISLYSEYLIATKVYQEIIKDINPEVSDDEARNITIEYILIKTYFQDGTGKRIDYGVHEKATAKETAEKVYELAMAGEDFENLILEYNEDDKSIISLGKRDIEDKAVSNTLFNLANEEISPVLNIADGYLVARVLSTYDLAETDANKISIVEEQREAVFEKEYDEFVPNLTRKLNDTLWDRITFLHDSDITTSDFFAIADDNL